MNSTKGQTQKIFMKTDFMKIYETNQGSSYDTQNLLPPTKGRVRGIQEF